MITDLAAAVAILMFALQLEVFCIHISWMGEGRHSGKLQLLPACHIVLHESSHFKGLKTSLYILD